MNKLLWLDDIRNPLTDDELLLKYAPDFLNRLDDIVWVRNYQDFVRWIEENGLPLMVAFDYDLGEDVATANVARGMSKKQARRKKKDTINGLECAKWLVIYCLKKRVRLPKWTIQSQSPEGIILLQKELRSI